MFGRRREQPAAAPTAAEPLSEAGHALRAPSRLHAFNRYEIKYLVDRSLIDELRIEFRRRLDLDEHTTRGGYAVWSLYYDTPSLRFYWEKIEGLRFRRKLRLRLYGEQAAAGDDTPVFVEIKQRVNRVTQKRRVLVPYGEARTLCDRRQMIDYDPSGIAFLEEVLGLVDGLDLRPVALTGYRREAYVGRDADVGLRVTLDHRIRGRDRDLRLDAEAAENRYIIPPRMAVLEVKANDRVPSWLTDLTARHNLSVIRVSKYCQSVETFGRAPRSIFHIPEG